MLSLTHIILEFLYIVSGGEGRLTVPNLNPSGFPAAYHRLPYGVSMYVMSFKNKNKNLDDHEEEGPQSMELEQLYKFDTKRRVTSSVRVTAGV